MPQRSLPGPRPRAGFGRREPRNELAPVRERGRAARGYRPALIH